MVEAPRLLGGLAESADKRRRLDRLGCSNISPFRFWHFNVEQTARRKIGGPYRVLGI